MKLVKSNHGECQECPNAATHKIELAHSSLRVCDACLLSLSRLLNHRESQPHGHEPEKDNDVLPKASSARVIAYWYKHHTNPHRRDCSDCARLYRAALADMLKLGKAYYQRVSAYDKRPARGKGKRK